MKPKLLFSIAIIISIHALALPITGAVIDARAQPLPSSSIYVKGSSKGTTANAEGRFLLELAAGTYTLVCSHVGYATEEREITVSEKLTDQIFRLYPQKTEYKEVVVKANAEDPAYSIIRHAIKERENHLNELKAWRVLVYMKGMIRTVQVPNRILGRKVEPDRNIIDSNGKGIIYFSESLTNYSRQLPKNYKEDIVSAKVAGRSNGFGFNSPHEMDINLYENNIDFSGLNDRGFVSPIANNALNFYKYKYVGTYYENGLEINKIQVIPRRKYEPIFAGGYINIIEESWRLQAVDLYLTKTSQLEFVDSFHVQQQMIPLQKNIWVPQQSSFFASFGALGFKANANFSAVFSDYDLSPNFTKKTFGNTIRTADTSANKKSVEYWETIRPMPLTDEEKLDYLKKDTLEKKYKDPHYMDSINAKRNKISFGKIVLTGVDKITPSKKMFYHFDPLLNDISYNTVEGAVVGFSGRFTHYGDTGAYTFSPSVHYGFANHHLQASVQINKTMGSNFNHRWNLNLGLGKNMFQINGNNPINVFDNSISTLRYESNYMKLYEKTFVNLGARKRLADGLTGSINIAWENRNLPENADTVYKWKDNPSKHFSSNYPTSLPAGFFPNHKAFFATIKLSYQGGQKFIEYPNRRFSIGSNAPVFTLTYTHGFNNIFGSSVNFDKWRLGVSQELKMKLAGSLRYRFALGGFLNDSQVYLPDWQHFNGNEIAEASAYLNSFQLMPYYSFSNHAPLYAEAHLEYHLNGLITNKIPIIKKWNWNLVTGTNSFYINPNKYYSEVFFGVENILKVLRVDFNYGYQAGIAKPIFGIRLGIGGAFSGD